MDYRLYEQYVARVSEATGIEFASTIEEALCSKWGCRLLSPEEFAELALRTEGVADLVARWSDRLSMEYDRENAHMVELVEEVFADLPSSDSQIHQQDDAA